MPALVAGAYICVFWLFSTGQQDIVSSQCFASWYVSTRPAQRSARLASFQLGACAATAPCRGTRTLGQRDNARSQMWALKVACRATVLAAVVVVAVEVASAASVALASAGVSMAVAAFAPETNAEQQGKAQEKEKESKARQAAAERRYREVTVASERQRRRVEVAESSFCMRR